MKQFTFDIPLLTLMLASLWAAIQLNFQFLWVNPLLLEAALFLGVGLILATVGYRISRRALKKQAEQLQDTASRYQFIVDNAPVVFYALDTTGLFTISVGKGLEQLGLAPGEVVGRSVFDVYKDHPELREYFYRCIKEKEPVTFEFSANGAWFDCIFTPVIKKGNTESVLGISVDVTERVHAEEALKIANDSLSATVALKAREVREVTEERMKAEKLASLDRLTATVAHEINTPVGVAYTAASFIQVRLKDLRTTYKSGCLDEAEFAETMEMVNEGLEAILSNLGTAADLIKVYRRASIDAEETSNKDRVIYPAAHEQLWQELKPMLGRRNITFDASEVEPVTLIANRTRINQVFSNIMRNALEHGFKDRETGWIKFEGKRDPKTGCIWFKASNNGAKIPEEALAHVAEAFYTTDPSGPHSGLGLHIIQSILQENTNLKEFKVYNTDVGVAVEFLAAPRKGGWSLER